MCKQLYLFYDLKDMLYFIWFLGMNYFPKCNRNLNM